MTRIVRAPDGTISRDDSGRAAGRGTYICHEPTCRDAERRIEAVKRALGAAPTAGTLEFEGATHATT
jgi:predicted RNA-binding protein YlxR (DUF448 family)